LDRFPHREVEVLRLLADDKVDSAHDVRANVPAIALHEENLLSQAPVQVDAEKALTDGDENGKMQNRVRRELPELDAIGKKEAKKKFVG
jgi:hypothetical protein